MAGFVVCCSLFQAHLAAVGFWYHITSKIDWKCIWIMYARKSLYKFTALTGTGTILQSYCTHTRSLSSFLPFSFTLISSPLCSRSGYWYVCMRVWLVAGQHAVMFIKDETSWTPLPYRHKFGHTATSSFAMFYPDFLSLSVLNDQH